MQYVEREIFFKINNKTITKVPVAWIQDDRYKEMIIGREVVFDTFDIEYVSAVALTEIQIQQIEKAITTYLEKGLSFSFTRKEKLERSTSGKLKQFVSLVK